ncbi:uncharacterized protein SPPG_01304 [Spizellomyces punctatus DAOM BR117]|uniref:Uncharacterized protein n=1 Tax=Spizellomyces punctatus (strain DAOM BR117) TaxID=645134 RepID=A0A0L0HSK4_SPIPD|nr:uncharacterized protein SPPG_01304 [Spizellomyces punctatus DAOM BR117]KND03849.1 hypothetical protein SPPG_01304 [Spizellomyces punctatus DAOM BR117]|eukprot:XP_016611888.1 hypothetical protein SPPG_01304 [Spizellomyces punctatus DAOM BR117]
MSLHACPCLNIKVRAAPNPPVVPTDVTTAGDADSRRRGSLGFVTETDSVKGYKAQLGLGGITIEHKLLVKHVLLEKSWLEVRCLNCGCSAYFIRVDPTSHHLDDLAASAPADRIVIVGETTIYDDAIEKDKQTPRYSESCRIILLNDPQKPEHLPVDYGFSDAYKTFEAGLKRYIESKRLEMEERIAAFRTEQQAILERQRERALRDSDTLWARICDLHREKLHRTAHSTSPELSTEASAIPLPHTDGGSLTPNLMSSSALGGSSFAPSSLYERSSSLSQSISTARRKSAADLGSPSRYGSTSVDQSDARTQQSVLTSDKPENDDGSVGDNGSASQTELARKVRFEHDASTREGVDEYEGASEPHTHDDDVLFDLDGFENDKGKQTSIPSSDSEHDDEPGSPVRYDPPELSSVSIFSSSLPIRIPSIPKLDLSTDPDAVIPEEEDRPHDDEDQFVAPHILSAKTYTEDYLLNQRPPKSRKTSFAI